MTVLALDIGGTKFAAAHVTPDGSIVERDERPIGSAPTATLEHLVADFTGPDLTCVGIGTAGPLEVSTGMVSPVNIRSWRSFPLVEAVSRQVGDVPVVLAGDAQCMAVGEWWLGDHTAASLLGIVVSTGIGGGLVVQGRPLLGSTGNAGHIGHTTIDRDGDPCPCGARGCLETIASGPSIVRWALAQGWRPNHPVSTVTTKELAQAARDGAVIPNAAFDRAAKALAAAIRNAAALLDISNVVIGGGVAAVGDLLLVPMRHHLHRLDDLAFLQGITITASSLARDAGLLGAAAIALQANGATLRSRAVVLADRQHDSADRCTTRTL
ncbi:ROK family protein [Kribbella catacumbae]|uniref:ROK family protein n=1 Tax=Kribbella catacumbae TaxID=460086 RepID=UPI00039FC0C0|nr:ROK family protein [Kribbella catacumbae]